MSLTKKVSDGLSALDSRPGLDYLMIRLTVLLLTGIGVVMVMSSSMTWSVIEGSSVWGGAARQTAMVFAGLVAFWAMLKIPPRRLRSAAWWLLGIAVLLLVAVLIPGLGTGREEVGSQSWLVLGPLRLQPSEAAKIAVAIFGAHLLADRRPRGLGLRSPFTIFIAIGVGMTLLIMAEGDLGMAVAFALVVGFVLIFAGVDKRWLIGLIGAGALTMVAVFAGGGFRSHRFHVYFDALFGRFTDTRGTAFQSYQGFLSLADGSVGGVGLGQSRAKWFYLPEARNDFIFAIIGEELGLWGGALVIILFGTLGFFGLRTALRAADHYQALLAGTLTATVVSQAFINIGYVVGVLPVTGIQLPLISAGGTSAIITLAAMGILANIARHEPAAVSAMQSYGRPVFDRLLFISEPDTPAARRDGSRRPRRTRGEALTSGRRSRIDDAPVRAGARTGSRSGAGSDDAGAARATRSRSGRSGHSGAAGDARGTRGGRGRSGTGDRRDVGNRTRNAPTSQRRYHRS
ncbi:FtsW/RodA/SpoVE family cell cycle protein [Corynebacterium frankenforstense]|uniref:FtsW/RodA/SpoVE family cell cycle protein n=1 Tax=Corynebacterium frankenforstense TaxID=1230998 RepID=UPI001FE5D261|nr:putative peptidoglycan glycosyltransferase FtsW [Corynebacterium frankenforstense]